MAIAYNGGRSGVLGTVCGRGGGGGGRGGEKLLLTGKPESNKSSGGGGGKSKEELWEDMSGVVSGVLCRGGIIFPPIYAGMERGRGGGGGGLNSGSLES